MKGLIFTSFLHLVEKEYGLEMVDKVIAQAAPPSGGIYTTVGNYDHRELIAMIAALSKNINLSVGHLTKTFGVYLFAELIAAYPQWITNFNSSFALRSFSPSCLYVLFLPLVGFCLSSSLDVRAGLWCRPSFFPCPCLVIRDSLLVSS